MPLYFFDTTTPDGECHDEEGAVLANPEAAQRYARRALCEIAGDRHAGDHLVFMVRVRDLIGAEVYRTTLTLSDALPEGMSSSADRARFTPDDPAVRPCP